MKKLFLLFSHTLTSMQEENAKAFLEVEQFVTLPKKLQNLWSNIPPHLTTLHDHLAPLKAYISKEAKRGDLFLIQGDFGGCYEMVNFVKDLGFTAVHSTTMRDVVEKTVNGKVEKFSRFEHVIFRLY
ncbi:MAG: Unknown protein [uncultured Sulfurovum sp.]|uniref:Uncharacterized protein n=1 Tax=uncultured Sulfurovum sp. TaxID=269237 RepID=A0A6S6TDP6_9BACT|nr:MAG: Unknown protein [uncultured Sulfurovum sp.]